MVRDTTTARSSPSSCSQIPGLERAENDMARTTTTAWSVTRDKGEGAGDWGTGGMWVVRCANRWEYPSAGGKPLRIVNHSLGNPRSSVLHIPGPPHPSIPDHWSSVSVLFVLVLVLVLVLPIHLRPYPFLQFFDIRLALPLLLQSNVFSCNSNKGIITAAQRQNSGLGCEYLHHPPPPPRLRCHRSFYHCPFVVRARACVEGQPAVWTGGKGAEYLVNQRRGTQSIRHIPIDEQPNGCCVGIQPHPTPHTHHKTHTHLC